MNLVLEENIGNFAHAFNHHIVIYESLNVKFCSFLTFRVSNGHLQSPAEFLPKYLYFVDLHLSIILDNDQRDAHLLYFTIYLLNSSTYFDHYMLIIRRLNCIDAASGIVLSVSGRPVHRADTD